MLRFIVRRLLQAIPTLLILSILVFAWLRSLPGGPAGALLGDKATPEKIANLNHILGLDQPIFVQYFKFLGRVLTGDFGNSLISTQPVIDEVLNFLPATIELSIAALIISVGLGIPLGYVAARFRGGILLRIIDDHPFEAAVVVERDKRRAFLSAAIFGHQESGPLVGRPRHSRVADADVTD